MNKKELINEMKSLILKASKIINKKIDKNDIYIQYQSLNHQPLKLPDNKMAIYTFVYNNEFLKIGQANYNSKARYQYHHYYVKSGRSTLANRLLNDPIMNNVINKNDISTWIKENCERFDVIIDKKYGKYCLNFIEGMFHYKYNPKYEK